MSAANSDNSSLNRRQLLVAGAALLAGVPLSALAKSGDSPNISIFGVGGQSSPFTAGIQTGGSTLYTEFNEDELAVFKRIAEESKERIAGAGDAIKAKQWEDIRSRCRLEAYEFRKVQKKINESITEKSLQEKAVKASAAIKADIEQLDQACVQKNQDLSFKKYNALVKDIDAWVSLVGL